MTRRPLPRARTVMSPVSGGPRTCRPMYIGQHAATERLYALERAHREELVHVVHELLRVRGLDRKAFWTEGVPTALYDALAAYEPASAIAAASALLDEHGYDVTPRDADALPIVVEP